MHRDAKFIAMTYLKSCHFPPMFFWPHLPYSKSPAPSNILSFNSASVVAMVLFPDAPVVISSSACAAKWS